MSTGLRVWDVPWGDSQETLPDRWEQSNIGFTSIAAIAPTKKAPTG